MDQEKLGVINEICLKTRRHLETNPALYTQFMKSPFPKGWCGKSVELLIIALSEKGLSVEKCSGNVFPDAKVKINHAWLECEGYIIDITADQFNDMGYSNPPVMVTDDDTFHRIFVR